VVVATIKKIIMKSKQEEIIHTQICDFLNLQYPNVIFTSDASGVFVGKYRAIIMSKQRSKHKIPDLLIFEPKGGYFGLFIEVKAKASDIFLKDRKTLKKSEHLEAQLDTLNKLISRGYAAKFGVGLDHCISIIDKYMNLPKIK
jgi:hypothetical protein